MDVCTGFDSYGAAVSFSASVDSKPLTQTLSPLDATLTKNPGGG